MEQALTDPLLTKKASTPKTTVDILLVDDDITFAQLLARNLHKRGLKAIVAHAPEVALTLAIKHQPPRILLDLKLEHSSGLHLIADFKKHVADTTIVILTGYSSIPTTVEAIKLGAENYLCKPASVDEILAAFVVQKATGKIHLATTPPSVDRLEWEHIQRVLTQHDGNISATARALGMHRRTLQRKLQKRPVKS